MRKELKRGENYITRNFTVCTFWSCKLVTCGGIFVGNSRAETASVTLPFIERRNRGPLKNIEGHSVAQAVSFQPRRGLVSVLG
jgi:hypothetical protein